MSVRYRSTNLSQGSLFWHHEALPSEAKQWTRGTDLSISYLTLMIDSFSCILFCANAYYSFIFTLKYAAHLRQPFCFLTSFPDILLTFVSDQVTWRPLQPVLSTGSEHQGQNIRVRQAFLTLTKTLDLLVFFHRVCKKCVFLHTR